MKLIFGDKESIRLRDQRRYRSPIKLIRYLSECCSEYIRSRIDWERPINGTAGVTQINSCSKCNKECFVIRKAYYEEE